MTTRRWCSGSGWRRVEGVVHARCGAIDGGRRTPRPPWRRVETGAAAEALGRLQQRQLWRVRKRSSVVSSDFNTRLSALPPPAAGYGCCPCARPSCARVKAEEQRSGSGRLPAGRRNRSAAPLSTAHLCSACVRGRQASLSGTGPASGHSSPAGPAASFMDMRCRDPTSARGASASSPGLGLAGDLRRPEKFWISSVATWTSDRGSGTDRYAGLQRGAYPPRSISSPQAPGRPAMLPWCREVSPLDGARA